MTTTEPRRTGSRAREPDRNLAVELIRATEAAAMASARYLGRVTRTRWTPRSMRCGRSSARSPCVASW